MTIGEAGFADRAQYWLTYFKGKPGSGGGKNCRTPRQVIEGLLERLGVSPDTVQTMLPDINAQMPAQAFVTGETNSLCWTHRDETDSLLIVIRGNKSVALKKTNPTDVSAADGNKNESEEMPILDMKSGRSTPTGAAGGSGSSTSKRRSTGDAWTKVDLTEGDALVIPKGWWHQVESVRGSVALSIRLNLGGNANWNRATDAL
jgi:hypothetical protein